MKERQILFNGEMVRAILDGRKTETRRPIKPQPMGANHWWQAFRFNSYPDQDQGFYPDSYEAVPARLVCPYGIVGDRLWVRETFVLEATDAPYPDRPYRIDEESESEWGKYIVPHYRATEPEPHIVHPDQVEDDRTRWSPCIFMPRWACRIVLEVTKVDIQRLQQMTQKDAKADGASYWWMGSDGYREIPGGAEFAGDNVPEEKRDYLRAFRESWEPIYRKRGFGWDVNPWVWVITFQNA